MNNKKNVFTQIFKEMSKFILFGVMVTYFILIVFGMYIVYSRDCTLLRELFVFAGAQITTALSWYFWKAKNENCKKGDDK